MILYDIIRPLIFGLSRHDPETAHERVLDLLDRISHSENALETARDLWMVRSSKLHQRVFSLVFQNPVGLAGGFSKNGDGLTALAALGFGFLEMGTVTKEVQEGNPRPRIFRLPQDQALINRMGFNNLGATAIAKRLGRRWPRLDVPLGINIGKSKITPQESAAEDYAYSFGKLYHFADYFVVNVSSPNTPGLRQLQDRRPLGLILSRIREENERLALEAREQAKPVLLKLSPDLEFDAVGEAIEVALEHKIGGVIVANTTIGRTTLRHKHPSQAETGGLSGRPLLNRAIELVSFIRRKVSKTLPVVGVGGISTAEDAFALLREGANLVQLYTSLIYQGPSVVHDINRGLLKIMEREKINSVADIYPLTITG